MPGGDGTGPMGQGPMTGRGLGYCAGYAMPGYVNPVPGRGLWGRGRGWGRGGGRGRGWRGYWGAGMYGSPAYGVFPYGPELSAKDESALLKDQAQFISQQLKDIQERINTLEKAQSEEK